MKVGQILKAACLCGFLLGGCAAGVNTKEEMQAKAYGQIVENTHAVHLGEGRIRIEASSPFLQRRGVIAYDLLARAAAEARAMNKPRFAIVYLSSGESGLLSALTPKVSLPQENWIGAYEDLLSAQNWQSLSGDVEKTIGHKRMIAVVRILEQDEEPDRDAFDAASLYTALLTERIERKRINERNFSVWPF